MIGKGGIGKTVADDHFATRQRGLDDLNQMVAARGKGNQRLGQRVHGVMQHQGAQLFGQRRAAGLTRQSDYATLITKGLRQTGDVRGLARTVNAFKTDEQTLG